MNRLDNAVAKKKLTPEMEEKAEMDAFAARVRQASALLGPGLHFIEGKSVLLRIDSKRRKNPNSSKRLNFTQGLAYVQGSVRMGYFQYQEKYDGKEVHHDFTQMTPRALNYEFLSESCRFYKFPKDHPDARLLEAFKARRNAQGPPYLTVVMKEGVGFVWEHAMTDVVEPVSNPPNYPRKAFCFRQMNWFRTTTIESDITSIILLYSTFVPGCVITKVEYDPPRKDGPGRGQVYITGSKLEELCEEFARRPFLVDHHGVWVVRPDYEGQIVYAIDNKHCEKIPFPFAELIARGDKLS